MMDGNTGYSGRLIRSAAQGQAEPANRGQEAFVPAPVDPAQAEAESLLVRTEVQVRQIVAKAEAQAEDIREAARATGEEAANAAKAEALIGFSRTIRKELDDIRPMLARMVVEAVEAIIGTLPEDDIAERMIRRALRDLDTNARVILFAARGDFEVLSGIVSRMADAGERSIQAVQPDPDLESGSCRLQAAGISVELGLRAQLDLLEAMLLREDQGEGVRHERVDFGGSAEDVASREGA